MTSRALNETNTSWALTANSIASPTGGLLTISNISTATTINSSVFIPQQVAFLTSNTSTTTGSKDNNQRQLYINATADNSSIIIYLNNLVWNSGTQYSYAITLTLTGHSVELIWNASNNYWYVVGYTFASFS